MGSYTDIINKNKKYMDSIINKKNLGSYSPDIITNKKIALIVGIDTYEDTDIPILSGAQNDALELYELLSSNTGGFIKDNNKCLLIGERATHRNILKQVAEIFRQDENFDIALFYFSGYGFVDKKDDLYLSTFDVDKKDPYVGGIKVDDLIKQIYSSKNKRTTIIILDCCYRRIDTNKREVKREIAKLDFEPYLHTNFQNKDKDKSYGSGKFIIASSANDKFSWEKPYCKHSDNDKPHIHGVFTYYLLEGLKGGAADSRTGEITLLNLQEYIDHKLLGENKPYLYFQASEATNPNAIRISVSMALYQRYISDIENEIETYFPQEDSSFPSILYIIVGATKLQELQYKDVENRKIPIFRERLSSKLEEYKREVIKWCDNLPINIKIQLGQQTGARDIIHQFSSTVADLNIDSISIVGEKLSPLLDLVGNQVKYHTEYKDLNPNDLRLTTFLMRFASLSKSLLTINSLSKSSVNIDSTLIGER